MNSSFRLMSRMIWLHFLCFVVKDTTFASERHLKGGINNKNGGQESTTCPCFDQKDFNNGVDKVLYLSFDYYSGGCEENQSGPNSRFTNNGISFRVMNGDGRPAARGFSVQVDKKVDGQNDCMEDDMKRSISQEEAKVCLSIVNTGCKRFKDKVCPCFNFKKLQEAPIDIDPDRSCRRHDGIRTHDDLRRHRTLKKSSKKSSKKGSKKETWGLFQAHSKDDDLPFYGIEKDTKGKSRCIGNAEVFENKLNADQYDHCTKLLERICTD
jgi:hypothetical protein